MKTWWRRHRVAIIGFLGYPIVRLLTSTLRYRSYHKERLEDLECGAILAGLHARGILAAGYFRRRNYWVLVSLSRDGEIQNRVYSKFGYRTIRGSTGRGGVKATLEAIRVLKEGRERLVIAIDGPRGPRGVVQEGALLMAKKSGAAIVPMAMSPRKRWKVNTWDFFAVPKPFSFVAVVYGEPIFVPSDSTPDQIEAIRQRLEVAIHALEDEADSYSGHAIVPGERKELPTT